MVPFQGCIYFRYDFVTSKCDGKLVTSENETRLSKSKIVNFALSMVCFVSFLVVEGVICL